MESFGNFLRSLAETINNASDERNQNDTREQAEVIASRAFRTDDESERRRNFGINSDQSAELKTEIRRESSTLSESGYGSENSSRRSSTSEKDQRERQRRMEKYLNQAREDDDEEFGASARRRRLNAAGNGGNGVGAAGPAIALAAVAVGAFAIGKLFFSSSSSDNTPNFPTTSQQIIDKIREIEEDTKEHPVVGFDCQWTIVMNSSQRSKIALLQLCSWSGKIALIPMKNLYSFPEELKSFLRNGRIIKAGIETVKDARFLLEDYGLTVKGTYDIRYLAEDCGHKPLGLQQLSERILGLDLGRDWELVASDWDEEPLDERQKSYAEKAVKASIDIFKALVPYAIPRVNRNEILNYCFEHVDRAFVYYSQRY